MLKKELLAVLNAEGQDEPKYLRISLGDEGLAVEGVEVAQHLLSPVP